MKQDDPIDLNARSFSFSRRTLLRLLIPLIIEQILNTTVGMVDTLMVSSAGDAAVSGVSLVDTINLLIISFQTALATGGAVIVAQYIGRGDSEKADNASRQLIHIMTLIGLSIGTLCFSLNRPLLSLIFGKAEAGVLSSAEAYFFFCSLSYPFIAFFSSGSALFRARGNTSISMIVNLIVNILNIIGNAIFIYGFDMGAGGAALATLSARVFGALAVLLILNLPRSPHRIESFFRISFQLSELRRMFRVGIPNGVDTAMFDVGKMLLVSLITPFGTAAIAANQVGNNLANLALIPALATNLAMTTVVGQCIGANSPDAAVGYAKKLLVFSMGALVITNGAVFIFAKPILSLFNLSEEAVSIAADLIRTHSFVSTLIWPAAFNTPNALRATGDSRFTMIVSVLSMWAVRVGGAYLFALGLGLGVEGVWFAMYSDWAVRAVFYLVRFFRQKWRKHKLI